MGVIRKFFNWKIPAVLFALIAVVILFRKPIVSYILNSDLLGIAAELIYPSSPDFPKPTGNPEKVTIHPETIRAQVDPRYVSFAVDTSQIVGGHWWGREAKKEGGLGKGRTKPFDFKRLRLINMAKALSPALVRIGGSEADAVYYDMNDTPLPKPPDPYHISMTKKQYDDIHAFAKEVGYSVFFCLNAGPVTRDDDGDWTVDNAKTLLEYTQKMGYKVDVWELGNEINGFWFLYGGGNHVSGERYARDFRLFANLVKSYYPETPLAGPSGAFWPLLGEPLGFLYGVHEDFLKYGGSLADIITWHYYPQQSRRCEFAVRRAKPNRGLDPSFLDEVTKWAEFVETSTREYAPKAQIWMGETGNAQCGGEPGVSNTYVGGLWWLDQLGLLAARGHKVVVRQTLSGSHYGLIDDLNLDPNPDYWNTLLWKKLMGAKVLKVEASRDNAYVRSYAHCAAGIPGGVTLLLINESETQTAMVIPEGIAVYEKAEAWQCTAPDILGRKLLINDREAKMQGDEVPAVETWGVPFEMEKGKPIELPPASYVFIRFSGVKGAVCR